MADTSGGITTTDARPVRNGAMVTSILACSGPTSASAATTIASTGGMLTVGEPPIINATVVAAETGTPSVGEAGGTACIPPLQ